MIDLSALPTRMKKLPLDSRGYPVPRFVEWIDGKPDFRIMSSEHLVACIKRNLCWLCGEPLGRWKCFVIGPMCSVNRVSGEPPSHRDCATFAVKVCPFLTRPNRRRDDRDLPEHQKPAGFMIEHNPGATLLWVTESYKTFRPGGGGKGVLFKIGAPHEMEWWSQGRLATPGEIIAAFNKGLPVLRDAATRDGPDAMKELETQVAHALTLIPKAA